MRRRIAVVGSGLVGQAWAIAFARGGFDVRMHDTSPQALEAALTGIAAVLPDLHARGLLRGKAPGDLIARISIHSQLAAALEQVVHVQENVPEKLEVKRAVFAELDRLAPPETTIASSTSALLTSAFAAGLEGQARCMVAHPLNPPHLIPVVEIVPAPFTDADAVMRCRDILRQAGQTTVVLAREVPGFVINRLQGALLDEAVQLVADGVISVEDIDIAVRDGLARRWVIMGPLETIDLNAPSGISGFIERYGPAYAEIGAARANRVAWDGKVADELIAARRAVLPIENLRDRQSWRDNELARLAAYFSKEGQDHG